MTTRIQFGLHMPRVTCMYCLPVQKDGNRVVHPSYISVRAQRGADKRKYTDTPIHRYTDTPIHRYTDPPEGGGAIGVKRRQYTDTPTHRYTDPGGGQSA